LIEGLRQCLRLQSGLRLDALLDSGRFLVVLDRGRVGVTVGNVLSQGRFHSGRKSSRLTQRRHHPVAVHLRPPARHQAKRLDVGHRVLPFSGAVVVGQRNLADRRIETDLLHILADIAEEAEIGEPLHVELSVRIEVASAVHALHLPNHVLRPDRITLSLSRLPVGRDHAFER
jgi:hypothetical protein